VTARETSDEPAVAAPDGGFVRLRLDLGYDGTGFSGWARQPGRRTVEDVVATGVATVLRLSGPPALVVAGRTDAGVHATGQVAHVDVPAVALDVEVTDLARRLRGVMPDDVAVVRVARAPRGFDARFSARSRRYRYRITDGPPDPLRRRDTLAWPKPLDDDRMHAAAQRLLGEHDWAAYCRPRPGASSVRRLHRLDVTRTDAVVHVEAEGDGFCHNQVRALVGALLAVGDGRRPPHWPRQVLLGGVRDPGVTVAPAHGLTLVGVGYPPDDDLADRARQTRARRPPPG
jgi:tRNA pseudouridine38-40 synthase